MTSSYRPYVPPPPNKTVEQLIETFGKSIHFYSATKNAKECVVLYYGKRVVLMGKSVWMSFGRAVSAIRRELRRNTDWQNRALLTDQKIKDWVEANFQVVSLLEYEINMEKLKNA